MSTQTVTMTVTGSPGSDPNPSHTETAQKKKGCCGCFGRSVSKGKKTKAYSTGTKQFK